MTTAAWCPACGSKTAKPGGFCTGCGAPALRATAAGWGVPWRGVVRAAGVLFLGVVALGIWGYFTRANSYEAQAGSIINSHADRIEEISDAGQPDMQRCSAGSELACDSTIESLSLMADEIDQASTELAALTPSAKAASWQSDYMSLLSDASASIHKIVRDWDTGDLDSFNADLAKLGPLESREENLTAYFNDNLR